MRKRVILLSLLVIAILMVLITFRGDEKVEDFVADFVLVEEVDHLIEFDETKWKTKKGWGYAYRNQMLDDLMNDPEIRKLKRAEIINLLGEPNRTDGDYLFYTVDQKRALILPLHTKTLVINLYPDSTINWMKIHQ